jgi:autotransporter-associated beta strand protein
LNTDTIYAGIIKNVFYSGAAKMALTKVGTGTLTLTGDCTYTGPTIVNSGTLEIDGSLAVGSAVTVATDATLAGTGAVNGSVEIPAGAFVAPGGSNIGTLTLGNATASGTYQCQLDATSGDLLAVNGALTVDGTTSITFSGTPVAASYTILTYGTIAGSLPAITPPAGYTVDLSTPGVVKIVNGGGYDDWALQITDENQRGRGDDPDGDDFTNLQEFLFGTSPIAGNGSLTTTEKSGGNLIIRWNELASGATYRLMESATLANPWVESTATIEADGAQNGDYLPMKTEVPTADGKNFFRVEGVEN